MAISPKSKGLGNIGNIVNRQGMAAPTAPKPVAPVTNRAKTTLAQRQANQPFRPVTKPAAPVTKVNPMAAGNQALIDWVKAHPGEKTPFGPGQVKNPETGYDLYNPGYDPRTNGPGNETYYREYYNQLQNQGKNGTPMNMTYDEYVKNRNNPQQAPINTPIVPPQPSPEPGPGLNPPINYPTPEMPIFEPGLPYEPPGGFFPGEPFPDQPIYEPIMDPGYSQPPEWLKNLQPSLDNNSFDWAKLFGGYTNNQPGMIQPTMFGGLQTGQSLANIGQGGLNQSMGAAQNSLQSAFNPQGTTNNSSSSSLFGGGGFAGK